MACQEITQRSCKLLHTLAKVIHMSKLNLLITAPPYNNLLKQQYLSPLLFSFALLTKEYSLTATDREQRIISGSVGERNSYRQWEKVSYHLCVAFTRFYLCDQIEADETWYVACTGKTERTGTVGRLREGVDEKYIKRNDMWGRGLDSSAWLGAVAISYDHGNESSGPIKHENFFSCWVTYLLNNTTRLLSKPLPKTHYNLHIFGLLLLKEEQ